ncbi:uncharacterized protein B0P05DRAFT_588124 [Gilbertella persicaria]|uniref:uncharacterized protein n=1 Tax=Gilbertella persicaria TaxID=101096 RepID=UPI00221FF4E6|nr:uncharacterized protein B0P05DRAFT_588124 [Gilbertella persicaria]KAI8076467.1 hypothetical protein B0P05DRAFT_588124 [Gilbertella persicaria]
MLLTRLLTTVARPSVRVAQRYASTSISTNTTHVLDKAVFITPSTHTVSVASVSDYVSRLRPFTVPAPPQPTMTTPTKATEALELTSVLRKRRLKMNKHKHKKLRKRTRALRKKLGK